MGRQIIRQPDGRYAVWSSVVDDFVMHDVTAQEIEDDFALEAAEEAREGVREVVRALKQGKRPYHQFTMTYDEAQALARGEDVKS